MAALETDLAHSSAFDQSFAERLLFVLAAVRLSAAWQEHLGMRPRLEQLLDRPPEAARSAAASWVVEVVVDLQIADHRLVVAAEVSSLEMADPVVEVVVEDSKDLPGLLLALPHPVVVRMAYHVFAVRQLGSSVAADWVSVLQDSSFSDPLALVLQLDLLLVLHSPKLDNYE